MLACPMKKLLLASTALVVGGQALAADMPLKAPPQVAQYFWTGCHVGGHVGAGWGTSRFGEPPEAVPAGGFATPTAQFVLPAGSTADVDTGAGFLGGVDVGCDYQFARNWVIGAAGDFSWADIHGHTNVAPDPFFGSKSGGPLVLNAKTEWLATATARLGYVFWDRWMLYGRGGAAWAHDKYSVQNLAFTSSTSGFIQFCDNPAGVIACNPAATTTRLGWTLGLGLEWAFAANWSADIEYDHYDFGTQSLTLTDPNGDPFLGTAIVRMTVKDTMDTVQAGINYHFSSGGP
jgi:outer membrane immunogenic protein